MNVKTEFGAKGDCKSDDTEALQKALDSLAIYPLEGNSHIYLPAGTYRITKQLTCIGRAGVAMIGEHPEKVILLWDGPKDQDMIWFNGRQARFGRMTLDGQGKARRGWNFQWHNRKAKDQIASSRVELADMVFKNLKVGTYGGGKQGWLDSEVMILRCRFIECSEFGIGLQHFNSVDWWVWDSEFVDCGVAVSNEPNPYGGMFHVYNSIFRRSKIADATIYHTQFYDLRGNVSIGSRRFFLAMEFEHNGSTVSLINNLIIDPKESDPIRLEQSLEAVVAQNTIITDKAGPAIRIGLKEKTLANALVVNNCVFGSQNVVEVNGQSFEYNNIASLEGAPKIPEINFGGFAENKQRKVFEVKSESDTDAVQKAIDQAVAYNKKNKGSRPVVHLPWGHYKIDKTLTVPANASIQIVGDNYYPDWKGTMLMWSGDVDSEKTVMFRLEGPSKVTLRHLGILGPKREGRLKDNPLWPDFIKTAIEITNADQKGGRIYCQESNIAANGIGMLIDGLDNSRVELRGHEGGGFGHGWQSQWDKELIEKDIFFPYPSVRAIGGAKSKKNTDANAGTWIYGTNAGRFQVTNGARIA